MYFYFFALPGTGDCDIRPGETELEVGLAPGLGVILGAGVGLMP